MSSNNHLYLLAKLQQKTKNTKKKNQFKTSRYSIYQPDLNIYKQTKQAGSKTPYEEPRAVNAKTRDTKQHQNQYMVPLIIHQEDI